MSVGPFLFTFILALSLVPASSQAQTRAKAKPKAQASCWDPEKEPAIAEIFLPKENYKKAEDQKTIQLIHDTIWAHREDIDPRLVYHRMVGESHGDPFVLSPDKKYYGLFQFGGKPYGSNLTHKQIIEGLYRKNPGVSPRLIQVKYYLEQYLQSFIEAADNGTGCNRDKKYHQYTNLEKSTYLNYGACNRAAMNREIAKCSKPSDAPYAKACGFSYGVTRGYASRVCERQNPGTRPSRPTRPALPVRSTARAVR